MNPYPRLAPVRPGDVLEMCDLLASCFEVGAVLQVHKVHVAVTRREVLCGTRAARVHHRRMGFLERLGLAPDPLRVEAFALEVELVVAGPALLQEIQPLGCIVVAVVMWAHAGTEHVKLVLEPAAHNVERESAVGHMINGGSHFSHHQRVHERYVTGRQHCDVICERSERRCPGEALERRGVEVRWSAVPPPSADWKDCLHARTVHRLSNLYRIVPVELPGFRDRGDRRAMAAIERHDAKLHTVAAEQASARCIVLCRLAHLCPVTSSDILGGRDPASP